MSSQREVEPGPSPNGDDGSAQLLREHEVGEPAAVSVVMPVFNTPVEHLQEAVDSILTQDAWSHTASGPTEPCEFIIVDDRSTQEETVSFLDRLDETGLGRSALRTRILGNEKHLGLSVTLDRAIQQATGRSSFVWTRMT